MAKRNPMLFYKGDDVLIRGKVIGQGPLSYLVQVPSGRQVLLYRHDMKLAPRRKTAARRPK